MKVLCSLDLASRTGYSILENQKDRIPLIEYGAFQLVKVSKIPDYIRVSQIIILLDRLTSTYDIDLVVIEEVHGQYFDSAKLLIKLQYVVQTYFYNKGIEVAAPIKNQTWKGRKAVPATKTKPSFEGTGIKKLFNVTEVDKPTSVVIGKQLLHDQSVLIDDNMTDSLLLATYFIKDILNLDKPIDYINARRVIDGIEYKSEKKPKSITNDNEKPKKRKKRISTNKD